MQFLKEKLRLVPNRDQNFTISLSSNNDLNGLQQAVNDVIEKETGLSINPADDGEKFRYSPTTGYTLNVYFYSGGSYYNTYEGAGFVSSDISSRSVAILSSFYIMQVYDSTATENQTLLHTGYFNGFNFLNYNSGNTQYADFTNDEFVSLYLPNWFIDSLSGETTTLYAKISFYNAKTGKLDIFYNGVPFVAPTGETQFYFTIALYPTSFNYEMGNIGALEITNSEYVNKMNNTLASFDNKKPTYPSGTNFNSDGTYN